jgi:hypothetical protein
MRLLEYQGSDHGKWMDIREGAVESRGRRAPLQRGAEAEAQGKQPGSGAGRTEGMMLHVPAEKRVETDMIGVEKGAVVEVAHRRGMMSVLLGPGGEAQTKPWRSTRM